jgi:hypothetical protein
VVHEWGNQLGLSIGNIAAFVAFGSRMGDAESCERTISLIRPSICSVVRVTKRAELPDRYMAVAMTSLVSIRWTGMHKCAMGGARVAHWPGLATYVGAFRQAPPGGADVCQGSHARV